jgi:hypothetical protein
MKKLILNNLKPVWNKTREAQWIFAKATVFNNVKYSVCKPISNFIYFRNGDLIEFEIRDSICDMIYENIKNSRFN